MAWFATKTQTVFPTFAVGTVNAQINMRMDPVADLTAIAKAIIVIGIHVEQSRILHLWMLLSFCVESSCEMIFILIPLCLSRSPHNKLVIMETYINKVVE